MTNRFIFFSILITALSSGCIDEVKLNIDTDQRRVAIAGLIADELDTYTIELDYSAVIGVGNDNVLDPITGASVMVLDDAGNSFDFIESTENPGIYEKEMKGEIGRKYHTEIRLADGQMIKSTPTVLLKSVEIDTIKARVEEEVSVSGNNNLIREETVVIEVSTQFPDGEKPFLRWRADGVYEFLEDYPDAISPRTCYVPNKVDLNKLKVFDTRILGGNRIEDEPFISVELNYRFAFNFCFHVFQYSMTEEEFRYWNAVESIINIDGSLFDPPPGTVRGNLAFVDNPEEVIVGYFSVSGVSSKRFFANPKALGVTFISSQCRRTFNRNLPPECFDCTMIRDATLERPEYWNP